MVKSKCAPNLSCLHYPYWRFLAVVHCWLEVIQPPQSHFAILCQQVSMLCSSRSSEARTALQDWPGMLYCFTKIYLKMEGGRLRSMFLEWKRIYHLMAKHRWHVGNEAKMLKTDSEKGSRRRKPVLCYQLSAPFLKLPTTKVTTEKHSHKDWLLFLKPFPQEDMHIDP